MSIQRRPVKPPDPGGAVRHLMPGQVLGRPARSRRVFTFHRPETLTEWLQQIVENSKLLTFRAWLKTIPPLDERGLWGKQAEAIRNLEQSLAEDRPGHRSRWRPAQGRRLPPRTCATG